jgi:hypothetical protein
MGILWLPQGQKPAPGQRVAWDAMGLPHPLGEWWLNEGCGALVNDASGNGNHGTLTNMDPATDWVGTAWDVGLDFDGSDDYVAVPKAFPATVPQAATIAARFIFAGSAAVHNLVVGSLRGEQWFEFGPVNTNAMRWRTSGNSGYGGVAAPGVPATAVFTYGSSPGTAYAYMDGSAVYNRVAPTSVETQLHIGRSDLGCFPGKVLWVITWLYYLTSAQVQALQGPLPIWVPQRYFDLAAAVNNIRIRNIHLRNCRVYETGPNR